MTTAVLNTASDPVAPRPRVLLLLVVSVLLAHLSLLSGGMAGFSLDLFAARDTELSGEALKAEAATANDPSTPSPATELELPEPVRVSTVRWIAAKPPEPEVQPELSPPQRVKVAPEPVVVAEAPTKPDPEPVPEPPAPAAPPAEVAEVAPAEKTDPAPTAPVSDLNPGAEVAAGTVQGAGIGAGDASLPPVQLPPSVQLRYIATALSKGSSYNGSAQLEWQQDGQQYSARLAARVLVFTVLEQTSAGLLNDRGILPDRFTNRSRSTERATHFDREGQRLRYSNNAPDGKLLPGTQDRLSINFQLAGLFNARPDAYAEGQTLRLPVTSTDQAEVWLFQVGRQAGLSTPAGEVVSRLLVRSPRREYDRKVEVWLMPEFAHLPGRIRVTEPNGDYLDLQLETLPVLPQTQTVVH